MNNQEGLIKLFQKDLEKIDIDSLLDSDKDINFQRALKLAHRILTENITPANQFNKFFANSVNADTNGNLKRPNGIITEAEPSTPNAAKKGNRKE